MLDSVSAWMIGHRLMGKPSQYVTIHLDQLSILPLVVVQRVPAITGT